MLRQILNRNLITVRPDTPLAEVAQLMAAKDVGSVLVVTDRRPVGIITDRDIVVRCLAEEKVLSQCKAEDVMTKTVHTCRETDGIFDCIRKMKDAQVRRMPVVDSENRAVGVISFGDLLAVLSKELTILTSNTTPAEDIDLIGELAS